ncbi:hypothetical protein CQW23_14629 [Capsicum baccatum]|uniref:EF-hand domain-containing protein n=1 Tax=Capsicum baccatum TaxID=33114 RepID=A0A2G2WJR6_CAPBA|nr:hypothetical protein CQW23_14629 [Capsicum baccatum]
MGKDLRNDQISSMKEAFTLFDINGDGKIAHRNSARWRWKNIAMVRVCSELKDLEEFSTLNLENNLVVYEKFSAHMQTSMTSSTEVNEEERKEKKKYYLNT